MSNNKLPKGFNLGEYAKDLYSRRNEAVELGWADCGSEEWAPKENDCHVNVTELCSVKSDLKPIRGWLFFDLEGINKVKFVAHSVVQATDGKFYDITPPNTIKRPPLIIAAEDEKHFEKLIINVVDFFYDPDS